MLLRSGVGALLLLIGAVLVAPAQPRGGAQHWVATWGTAQQVFQLVPAGTPPAPMGASPPAVAPGVPPPGTPARRFAIQPIVRSCSAPRRTALR